MRESSTTPAVTLPLASFCEASDCAARVDAFLGGQPIYVSIPSDSRTQRIIRRSSRWHMPVELQVGDAPSQRLRLMLPAGGDEGPDLRFALLCDASNEPDCVGTLDIVDAIARWAAGQHRVRVTFFQDPGPGAPILAQGTFTLAIDEPNAYVPMAAAARTGVTQARVMPRPAFSDAALEDVVRDLVRREGVGEARRVVFFQNWQVKTHAVSGVPQERIADVAIALPPEQEGSDCRIVTIVLRQIYEGSEYGAPRLVSVGSASSIRCENVDP